MTPADDQDWLKGLEAYAESLDDAMEHSVVASHVDHDWESKEQFIEYLKDHIMVATQDVAFLERWSHQLRPAFKMRVVRQDIEASKKLLKHLES